MTGTFRVEITTIAEMDVHEIYEYIAQDNSDAAKSFLFFLEEEIETLETFPLRCSLIPENKLLGSDYRHLLYGNYRIIFKIIDVRVIIMRILHSSRMLDIGSLSNQIVIGREPGDQILL